MSISPFRRAFAILLVVAAVVGLGLLFAQDQETLRIRSAQVATEPRFAAYVAALVGADLTVGNQFEVLTNGDQMFPAMLQAIDAARRRISFESYIYDTGEIAARFTEALAKAAERGVQVNILVDAVGASTMDRAHAERLRKAGAMVVRFNPTRWYSLEEVNYRTHRKILVVDGDVAFTGGAGVADHWLGHAQDPKHWRDTQVKMQGPIVRVVEAAFFDNFMEATGPITPMLDDPPPSLGEDGASMVVCSSPTGGSSDLKRLYLLAIASARRTLDIASPYFVTDESTIWAIEDAVGRGVRIRVLVEGDITDAKPVKYASRAAYERLLGYGIEIYEYQPTMMHAKALVADGVFSIFGSANFDNRSLELNDELNVAVKSRDLASRFISDFDTDLRASRRLDLERWKGRPAIEKAREQFWSYFGEIF